jgi:DNA-directed RNA polymerase specialized sigma24 family protein
MVYCVVSREVAGRIRRSVERGMRDRPDITVLRERRSEERRERPERRQASEPRAAWADRRRIRYVSGRRVAERREALVAVAAPTGLPRAVRTHLAAVSFVEALEVPADFREDIETVRAIVRFQAGERDFAELYGRWFDSIYTYMRVTLDRASDVEGQVAHVISEALRQLPRVAPGPAQLRSWLFGIVYDGARAIPLGDDIRPINGHGPRSAGAEDRHALDWLSDEELVLLIERRPLPERHVLVLRYFAGLGWADIGEVMAVDADVALSLHEMAVDSLDSTLAALTRSPRVEDRLQMGRLIQQTPVLHRRRRALLAV